MIKREPAITFETFKGHLVMGKMYDSKWFEKTKKINKDHTLRRGDAVIDCWGNKGIVVEIVLGDSISNHGGVKVWQSERVGYGGDNCEDYPWFNWKEVLRFLDIPDFDATFLDEEERNKQEIEGFKKLDEYLKK